MKTYSKTVKYTIQAIVLIAGLFWIWLSRIDEHTYTSLQAPQAGYFAPSLELSTLGSETLALSDFQGRPIILNFWASWCPPCRAEMPDFQQASVEYGDTGLIILGVNATNQDALNEVNLFISDHEVTFPIMLDTDGEATRDYQVHSLPTTFFIDRSGRIDKVVIGGPLPLSFLRIEAERLLLENR